MIKDRESFSPKHLEMFRTVLQAAWSKVETEIPVPMRDVMQELMATTIIRAGERGETEYKALRAAALEVFGVPVKRRPSSSYAEEKSMVDDAKPLKTDAIAFL